VYGLPEAGKRPRVKAKGGTDQNHTTDVRNRSDFIAARNPPVSNRASFALKYTVDPPDEQIAKNISPKQIHPISSSQTGDDVQYPKPIRKRRAVARNWIGRRCLEAVAQCLSNFTINYARATRQLHSVATLIFMLRRKPRMDALRIETSSESGLCSSLQLSFCANRLV